MSSLLDKGLRLALALLAVGLLLSLFPEATGAQPSGAANVTPGAMVATAILGILGLVGQRSVARRLDRPPRAPERRPFVERRRAEPPPPDFGGE